MWTLDTHQHRKPHGYTGAWSWCRCSTTSSTQQGMVASSPSSLMKASSWSPRPTSTGGRSAKTSTPNPSTSLRSMWSSCRRLLRTLLVLIRWIHLSVWLTGRQIQHQWFDYQLSSLQGRRAGSPLLDCVWTYQMWEKRWHTVWRIQRHRIQRLPLHRWRLTACSFMQNLILCQRLETDKSQKAHRRMVK